MGDAQKLKKAENDVNEQLTLIFWCDLRYDNRCDTPVWRLIGAMICQTIIALYLPPRE